MSTFATSTNLAIHVEPSTALLSPSTPPPLSPSFPPSTLLRLSPPHSPSLAAPTTLAALSAIPTPITDVVLPAFEVPASSAGIFAGRAGMSRAPFCSFGRWSGQGFP